MGARRLTGGRDGEPVCTAEGVLAGVARNAVGGQELPAADANLVIEDLVGTNRCVVDPDPPVAGIDLMPPAVGAVSLAQPVRPPPSPPTEPVRVRRRASP